MLKSRLQKLYNLTNIKLKENIEIVINKISKEKYIPKNKTWKIKKNYL